MWPKAQSTLGWQFCVVRDQQNQEIRSLNGNKLNVKRGLATIQHHACDTMFSTDCCSRAMEIYKRFSGTWFNLINQAVSTEQHIQFFFGQRITFEFD